MTIEVISLPDCPHHAPTVARIKTLLSRAVIRAEIREVLLTSVADARARGFIASPTVLVNGKDLEDLPAGGVGLSCRLYDDGSGIPSDELLRRAIDAARHAEEEHASR